MCARRRGPRRSKEARPSNIHGQLGCTSSSHIAICNEPLFRRCVLFSQVPENTGSRERGTRAALGRRIERPEGEPFRSEPPETAMLDLVFALVMLGCFGSCLLYTV